MESLISCLHTTSKDASHGVTASGILKNVASYKFLATTYFYADAVGILAMLSKCMQKESLLYSSIKSHIESACCAIKMLEDNDGPYFSEFCKKTSKDPPTELPMVSSFSNLHDVIDSEKQMSDFSSLRKALVKNILESLTNWFPDSEIMNCFSIFDPNGNVHDDQQALDRILQHFGDPKKDNLGESHAPIVDKIKSLVEYSVLKDVLKGSELSMQEFYRKIVHTNMDMYPNIGKLYQIALICPCTSVECERGFSQYNLIKTSHRNLLTVTHVDELAILTIEGPPLSEFNFDDAFQTWVTKKERRSFNAMYVKESKKTGKYNQ